MTEQEQTVLVPIRVDALVIEDNVDGADKLNQAKPTLREQVLKAGDFKWSPLGPRYQPVVNNLDPAGPGPFLRPVTVRDTNRLRDIPEEAMPRGRDRGVYLRWTLPSGMRRAHRPNTLDFPALPDQWLVLRFTRQSSTLPDDGVRGWFLESGVLDEEGGSRVLMPEGREFTEKRVGIAVPLEAYDPARYDRSPRTVLTALGNASTGSATFTASIAENRNVLSFHDKLLDAEFSALKKGNRSAVPSDTALTYLVIGWYRGHADDPLRSIPEMLKSPGSPRVGDDPLRSIPEMLKPPGSPTAEQVLNALGWKYGGPLETLLVSGRSIFHGMVAHINYWSPNSYQGPLLGYPGAPSAHSGFRAARPPLKVGIGNNAQDALIALVAGRKTNDEGTALWKALEAVSYRQTDSLLQGWSEGPRARVVHQSGFTPHEAGQVWSIHPGERKGMALSLELGESVQTTMAGQNPQQAVAGTPPSQKTPQPTRAQLETLKALNDTQARADALARSLAAAQQALYGAWWSLARGTKFQSLDGEDDRCQRLVTTVTSLRDQLKGALAELKPLPDTLRAMLAPCGLVLRSDPAPRFWSPADPVIVVQNFGDPPQRTSTGPLICRTKDDVAARVRVRIDRKNELELTKDAGLEQVLKAVKSHFPPLAASLEALMTEASLLEQATAHFVKELPNGGQKLENEQAWKQWKNSLQESLEGRAEAPGKLLLSTSQHREVAVDSLISLWGQQPWSPLFLDWQITWHPTGDVPLTKNDDAERGPFAAWTYDAARDEYVPMKGSSPEGSGHQVRGRSLVTPFSGRFFTESLDALQTLLERHQEHGDDNKTVADKRIDPRIVRLMSGYRASWHAALDTLQKGGLIGQALSGLHNAFLARDVTRPRVWPDPDHPWSADETLTDTLVGSLLEPLGFTSKGQAIELPMLPPPFDKDAPVPFDLLRAGRFSLDHLWMVDGFGQWADLLEGSSAGRASGLHVNPQLRWPENADGARVAMPPRFVQPSRLRFETTPVAKDDLTDNPIHGWIYHDYVNQALAVCDRDGRLLGELVQIDQADGRSTVEWESLGADLEAIQDPVLKAFARSLEEETPGATPRLACLLNLMEQAFQRMRQAGPRNEGWLAGRPLALVNARVGLELYGSAWEPPHGTGPKAGGWFPGEPSASPRFPVTFGNAADPADGLVGLYHAGDFTRFITPQGVKTTGHPYIAKAAEQSIQVAFGGSSPITMLMDPNSQVLASVGILPSERAGVPAHLVESGRARLELAIRVSPFLLRPDAVSLPTSVVDHGQWHFVGPETGAPPVDVVPFDPVPHLGSASLVAAEGWLILRQQNEDNDKQLNHGGKRS